MTTTTNAPDGKATTIKNTFSRETSVSIEINADPTVIWALLTNAAGYVRWNSTIISLEGTIAPGEIITLQSTLDPKRTFKLKIKEFEPEKRLVWGDSQGTRIYTLSRNQKGTITFSMNEKIGGILFPMYSRYIPAFDRTFEQFAANLKKEAEIIQNSKK